LGILITTKNLLSSILYWQLFGWNLATFSKIMSDAPIVPIPAPWKLKGTVYTVTFWCKAGQLPEFAYSPLEAASDYADPKVSGQHHGGTSQLQIIRYTESPVGPYDEMIIIPGFFDYRVEEGGQVKTKKNARVTRIYVSQKHTCWNGRKSRDKWPFSSSPVRIYSVD
jgi:hypothetical protein